MKRRRVISVFFKFYVVIFFVPRHQMVDNLFLLANSEWNSHLTEIYQQAREIYLRLVKQMAKQEEITSQVKNEKHYS